jgi:uncharacterized protein
MGQCPWGATMNSFEAAAFYVGLNILILIALIFLVVAQRRKHKVVIGDGGHKSLILAIRAHANAVEVMPMALVGLIALAGAGNSAIIIHILGVMLTIGRGLHAYGLSNNEGTSFGRMAGMLLSLLALIGAAVTCVLAAF